MEIFYYKDGFNYVNDKPINLCLGFFDGLHIGHKFLINKAKQLNENVGVLTFVGALKNLTNKRDMVKCRSLACTIVIKNRRSCI